MEETVIMTQVMVRNRRKRKNGRSRRSANAKAVGEFAGDAYDLATRALAGVKAIGKLINIETKAFDVSGTVNSATSWTVTPVSLVAQGTDYNTRVGDSIKVQTIHFGLGIYINAAVTTSDIVRVVLVRDAQNPGSTPSGSDIFAGNSQIAQENWLNRDRFSFVVDELVDMMATDQTAYTRFFKLPFGKHIKYRGTSAAAGSMAEGNFFLCYIGTQNTNTATVKYDLRYQFTDD